MNVIKKPPSTETVCGKQKLLERVLRVSDGESLRKTADSRHKTDMETRRGASMTATRRTTRFQAITHFLYQEKGILSRG